MHAMTTTIDARYIIPFECATPAEHSRMGGKCSSLATMINLGIPIPPGFAVTTDAYAAHLEADGLREAIRAMLDKLDTYDIATEEATSRSLRQLVTSRAMSPEVEAAIRVAYLLMAPAGDLPVAIRSSATAEDLPYASFAGQQDTYLGVVGADEVVARVRDCWASLFTTRAISYRADTKLDQIGLLMSVAVQKMVDASAAGVALTLDPINGDRTKIVIDSFYGVGEGIVSGKVTPDNFVVEKVLMRVQKRLIAEKSHELVADPAARRMVHRVVEPRRRTQSSLTDAEVIAVAGLARRLEKAMGCPQDVEWAIDRDLPTGANVVALQSRPETVWSRKKSAEKRTYEIGIAGMVGTLMAPIENKTQKRNLSTRNEPDER